MSQVSDMKMSLMWETERPPRGAPRQSSNFLLFGEEWHLKVEYDGDCSYSYSGWNRECRARLYSRNGKVTGKSFSATCLIVVNKLAIVSSEQYTVRNSGDLILKSHITSEDYNRIHGSQRWKVYCHFSCGGQPVPLQIIHLSTGSSSPNPGVQSGPGIPPDLQGLSNDFSRMLDKEIMPDATVTCGSRTWKVHMSVLTARSEVFAAMFRNGMNESDTGREMKKSRRTVKRDTKRSRLQSETDDFKVTTSEKSETSAVRINDLEPTVLDSLLKYVYSGKVPAVSGQNVSGLYEASDRYALHSLKKLLSGWMAEHLSHENCLGFLVVADAHSDAELKKAAVAFITNNFPQIEKPVWMDFRKKHLQLAVEVLEHFAPSMKK